MAEADHFSLVVVLADFIIVLGINNTKYHLRHTMKLMRGENLDATPNHDLGECPKSQY